MCVSMRKIKILRKEETTYISSQSCKQTSTHSHIFYLHKGYISVSNLKKWPERNIVWKHRIPGGWEIERGEIEMCDKKCEICGCAVCVCVCECVWVCVCVCVCVCMCLCGSNAPKYNLYIIMTLNKEKEASRMIERKWTKAKVKNDEREWVCECESECVSEWVNGWVVVASLFVFVCIVKRLG